MEPAGRPESATCVRCRVTFEVGRRGPVPSRCRACNGNRPWRCNERPATVRCAGCKEAVEVKPRGPVPRFCKRCRERSATSAYRERKRLQPGQRGERPAGNHCSDPHDPARRRRQVSPSPSRTPVQMQGIAGQDRRHPVLEYFADCEKRHPGPDIEYMLDRIRFPASKKFPRDTLSRDAIKLQLVAAVCRQHMPGASWKLVPVLCGTKFIAKSSFIRTLLPHAGWHATFDLHQPYAKRRAEALRGKVLVAIAELEWVSRAMSRIESILDTRRRCVFIGTSEWHMFLRGTADDAGWIPIEVNDFLDTIATGHYRDEIWAWACRRWRGLGANDTDRHAALLQRADKLGNSPEAAMRRKHARIIDLLTDGLANLIDSDAWPAQGMTIQQAIAELDLGFTIRGAERRVGAELRRRGFTMRRLRHDGKRQRVWFAPEAVEPPS